MGSLLPVPCVGGGGVGELAVGDGADLAWFAWGWEVIEEGCAMGEEA